MENTGHEEPAKPAFSSFIGSIGTIIGIFCTISTAILWVSMRTENNTWVNAQQEVRLGDHENRLRTLEEATNSLKRSIDGISENQNYIRKMIDANSTKIDKIFERLQGKL